MNVSLPNPPLEELRNAVSQLRAAAEAKKCWHCGCLRSSARAIEDSFPPSTRPLELETVLSDIRVRWAETKYDCLGCETCFPAIAINALGVEGDACPGEPVESREGWPPLAGSYSVVRYQASVAICTLTDEGLAKSLAADPGTAIGIVGTMQTENLGIERLVQNVVANPNLRFVVVCGADTRQAVGHLPGASLLALANNGVDEGGRILGAPGKRPVLRNIARDFVEHFRRSVEVIELIGETDPQLIRKTAEQCGARNPGPAPVFGAQRAMPVIPGHLPQRAIPDPAGYFVIYPDRKRRRLTLEHYRNDGLLDAVFEGATAAEVCTPAIERQMVSRLDHAAYLGRELARAEQALSTGEPYVQDAAPELHNLGRASQCCSSGCNCH